VQRRRSILWVVGPLFLAIGGCGGNDGPTAPTSPTPNDAVARLTSSNFTSVVLNSSGVVLVEFYLPTCPACQSMTGTVAQVARDYAGRAVVGAVDASTESTLTASYNVTLVPTFIVFKAGTQVGLHVGTLSRDDLAGMIEAALRP
jgi:thioredoxin 1